MTEFSCLIFMMSFFIAAFLFVMSFLSSSAGLWMPGGNNGYNNPGPYTNGYNNANGNGYNGYNSYGYMPAPQYQNNQYNEYYGSNGYNSFRMPDVIFADPYITLHYSYVNNQYNNGNIDYSSIMNRNIPAMFGGGFGLLFNNVSFIELTVSGGKNQIVSNAYISAGHANTIFLRLTVGAQIPIYQRVSFIASVGFLAHFVTGSYTYSGQTVPAGFSPNNVGISPEIGAGFAINLTQRLIFRFEVKNAFLGTNRDFVKNFTTIQTGLVLKI